MASRAMPTHNGPPAKSSQAPSPSLYVKNLPDKMAKQDLRTALYMLFSTYGPVLDVVAMKTASMRGQAHIVFRDIQTSSQAMRALQDFDFFGKQMKLQYAKGRSGIFTKLEGVYKPSSGSGAAAGGGAADGAQASIFNAPLPTSASTAAPPLAAAAAGLPPRPADLPQPVRAAAAAGTTTAAAAAAGGVGGAGGAAAAPSAAVAAKAEEPAQVPAGTKRQREEEESDAEEAPMEEDDDDDVSMEASSDEE